MRSIVILLLALIAVSQATIFFSETFPDNDGWKNRWVVSKNKGVAAGRLIVYAGEYFGEEEEEKGLKTVDDYRYYQASTEFPEFSNRGKTLVIQYAVKNEQRLDCGGSYIKVFPSGLKQEDLNGDSQYSIMFGPDICGTTTRRVHVIFNYKGTNHLLKREIPAPTDDESHVYTLIVKPDQTYRVLIDNEEKQSGKLVEDWDFLPPQTIPDPAITKPANWADEKEIDDPAAKKPEGWDDVPEFIRDPESAKPDDWDDSLDGEWEAPLIPNPEFKGTWVAPKIPNPAYKGPWIQPEITNPAYKYDDSIYAYDSLKYLGLEIWQVKAGSVFDNFLITDSEETASEWAKKTLKARKGEQAAKAFKKEKEEEERRRLENDVEEKEEAAAEKVAEKAASAGHDGHKHSKDEL